MKNTRISMLESYSRQYTSEKSINKLIPRHRCRQESDQILNISFKKVRTLRSGRLLAATAPAAWIERRVFFLQREVANFPVFLLLTEMATAPSTSLISTVLFKLARPEYLKLFLPDLYIEIKFAIVSKK